MGIGLSLHRLPPSALDDFERGAVSPWATFDTVDIESQLARAPQEWESPRSLDFDKLWDVYLALLSAERRRGGDPWLTPYGDPLAWAVVGRHVSTFDDGGGHLLKYNGPADVARVRQVLGPLSVEGFTEHLSRVLALPHVYRTSPGLNDASLPLYTNVLENLKVFYAAAAREGDAVFFWKI